MKKQVGRLQIQAFWVSITKKIKIQRYCKIWK